MLSTSFIFKRLTIQDGNEAVTKCSWNKTDGWLAYGGEQGSMRILMIETVDSHDFNLQGIAARPSRISIDRKVVIHEGSKVTSLNWNENEEKITSGDVRGSVVVCEYKDSKWASILVNESVQSPVVNAVWASDGSKILIFYQCGQMLLGAATGHKIIAVQIKQPDTPKFAFVSDSRHDFLIIGFQTQVIGYNFDSSEKYKILIPQGEKIISGHLVESKEKEEPKIVVITANGTLFVFSALNGMKLIQQQIQMLPSEIVVSPNNQYIAIAGQALEPHQKIDTSTNTRDAEYSAVLKLIRFCDLEQVAQIKIPAKIAICVSWDASSLRLAIGTENSLYLACLRLSYRHYMLRDGTVAFSLGSSILKTQQQAVKNTMQKKDECIVFFKHTVHKRWPAGFIDQCACGEYLAMILQREQQKADGSIKQLASVVFHSSVGAPALTLDLNYIPFLVSGCEHYLICANASRISLFDIRFLSGETKDYQNIMESKLDQGQAYNGVIEWHADSSPFAPDRELHVAKQSISSQVTTVCICNTALFIARANATVQRFNLPSLKSDVRIQTGLQLRALKANCNGTALAGVSDEGVLHVFYAEDFVETEITAARNASEQQEKIEKKQEKRVKELVQEHEATNDLTKMLGFDGEQTKIDKKAKQVITAEKSTAKVFPPWDTQLDYIWGIQWNTEDPYLLAVSSKHKIYVLQIEKRIKEEPITSSVHLLSFKGLQIHGVYLDEMVMYGEPKEGTVKVFDAQQLRELKDILYGKQPDEAVQADEQEKQQNLITVFASEFTDMTQSQKVQVNLSAAQQYLKQQQACHPHLYGLVAEAALRELALDVASQFYIRAGDYISYHFAEYIRRIGSDELRRAEVAIFLGDFKQAEYILIKQLGRPDLSLKNDEQLGMWFKIIATQKDAEYNSNAQIQVSDELSTYAHRQAGLYYLRQRDYAQAVTLLQKANDTNLLTEAYYRAEMYDELRQLATTLQVDVNYDAIIQTSKVLARIGDVEGATLALLRLNKPEDAIKVCITLKRFDKAILIAQEFNMLDVVDKHLSEYLRQLLSSGDDKAALDLLRKTNQGEIAACIIIGAAVEQLKEAVEQRSFPLKQGVFNRLRRLVVLAAKEAAEVQKRNITKELKNQNSNQLLTNQQTDETLNNLVNDNKQSEEKQEIMDNQLFARFGNKVKSTAMIWKIVRQTRYIVLASYMLYMNKPEQALFPAIEASGFYMKQLQNVGNFNNVVDEEYRQLQKVALPISILAALLIKDFDLASQLLEVLESDEQLPSIERDQLEQLAVDIFSKYPPTEQAGVVKDCQLQCEKCKTMMPKYCTVCNCGFQAPLCSRTGQPVNNKHKVQKCNTCGTVSTQGKAYLSICPMCHDTYE